MGNEQSSPSSRRRAQNKLSKPRTNTNRNLLNSKAPEIPSRQNTQSKNESTTNLKYDSVSVVAASEAGNATKDGPRGKRMSVFRSKSSQDPSRRPDVADDNDAEFSGRAPTDLLTRRHSVANSITFHHSVDDLHQSTSNARLPVQHNPQSQHHPRLSLVPEVLSTSPERGEFLKRDSLYGQENPPQLSNLPLPRTTSDTSLYGPIRRRSLQQPGVATRTSYIEDDSRQSLPSQIGYAWSDFRQPLPSQLKEPEQLQGYHHHSADSTLPQILTYEALGQPFNPGAPEQRVQTPDHMDYAHIGTFKLGSLRITNGAASPDFSDAGLSAGAEDDYLTMGKRRRARGHSDVSQAASALSAAGIARSSWTVQAKSPLRQSHESERTPLTIETQLPALDPSLGHFDFKSKYHPGVPPDAAHDYTPELTLSPFSFVASPTTSPTLQATSKHMAVEDDLFEPELTSPTLDIARTAPKSFDWEYKSVDDARTGNGVLDVAPKPLAKADSGYSSNVSVRSFRKDASPTPPPKDTPPGVSRAPVSRVVASMYSAYLSPEPAIPAEQLLTGPRPQSTAPSNPLRNTISAPPRPNTHEFRTSTPNSTPQKPEARTHIAMLAKYTRRLSLPTTPAASNEAPLYNDNSISSRSSTSSNSGSQRRSNKIQKPRPQSMAPRPETPVFTVQAMDSSSTRLTIPPVSETVEQMLVNRVNGFPVTNFPNTISSTLNLRRTPSKETLGTIFSVGSAEVRDEINVARQQGKLPPVQGIIPEDSASVHGSLTSLNEWHQRQKPYNDSVPYLNQFNDKRRSSRTKLAYPPSNVEEKQNGFEVHLTSVQTVTSSLGKSPHDIAASDMTMSNRSTTISRAKSMTSLLEAEAAARFQRARNSLQEAQSSATHIGASFDSALTSNLRSELPSRSFSNPSYEYPPQAHTNKSAWKPPSATFVDGPIAQYSEGQSMQKADVAGVSMPSNQSRYKSPPPVSMQTQGQITRILSNAQTIAHPLRSPPAAPAPDRPPPSAPTHSTPDQKEDTDPWAKHKNFWAERRKSAEVLHKRKSMESVQARSVRASFDLENESRLSDDMYIPRPESARPSSGTEPCQGVYKTVNEAHPQAWVGHSTGHHRRRWQEQQLSETYHNNYGSSYVPAQGYHQPDPEDDYFSPQDQGYDPQLPENIHARKNSTDEMLSLDPFPTDLGHSHQYGYGLVGSAGSRSVGNLASSYDVDFGHTRDFLQRVRVES